MTNSVRMVAAILVLSALGVVAPFAQQREGIKVHGDWVIEVRNSDGSLAQRHEFKNALVASEGDRALAFLLSRGYSAGRWQVVLWPESDPTGICQAGTLPTYCTVTENYPGAVPASTKFYTLQVRNPLTNPNPTVELTGTATAGRTGDIKTVEAVMELCSPTTSPTECINASGGVFYRLTRRVLPTAINVTAGQILQIKVVLSFS